MSQLSFKDIYSQIKRFVQASDDDLQLIKDRVNIEYRKLAKNYDWPELQVTLDSGFTLSSGGRYIACQVDVASVSSIHNTTRGITYRPKTTDRLVEDNVAVYSTSSTPYAFSVMGVQPITQPVSTSDRLEVFSTQAGDTDVEIRIVCIAVDSTTSATIRRTLSVRTDASDGTTEVTSEAASPVAAGWSIISIGSNQRRTGVVTIREATADTVLAYLDVESKHTAYTILQLEQPSSAADSLVMVYKRNVQDLVNDDDVPAIPVADTLIEEVTAHYRQFDKRYQDAALHKAQGNEYLRATLAERDLHGVTGKQLRPYLAGRGPRRGFST